MNKKKNTTIFILGFLAVFGLLTVLVWADSEYPYGVRNIGYVQSSRSNISRYLPANTSAEAGNVTELTLNAIGSTKSWAGFYGNITGTLTLETADGYVFYNWTTLEPKGEVYATINNSIAWATIRCWHFDGGNSNFDVDVAEGWYGIQDDDEDGINETFAYALDKDFFVGTVDINATSAPCQSTNTYVYDVQQQEDEFENILLTDNDVLIFTTIIENNEADDNTDITGFDNRPHDFQLLVAENGQDGQEDITTTYFFWAEIE